MNKKNILIITQKVNEKDDVLGFFVTWLREFSIYYEKITVLCLEKGDFSNKPKNIKVISLGKDKGFSKPRIIFNFYKNYFKYVNKHDYFFVHMNQIWSILSFPINFILNKKNFLWYAHRSTPLDLKIALKCVDKVFTPTKESFNLKTKKLNVLQHGIQSENFFSKIKKVNYDRPINIVMTGRISEIKDQLTLLKASEILKENKVNHKINIVGAAMVEEDKKYEIYLKKYAKKNNLHINFTGRIPNNEVNFFLRKNSIFVNTSKTGSLDKSVVEAGITGLCVLASQKTYIHEFGKFKNRLFFKEGDSKDLANKLNYLIKNKKTQDIAEYLQPRYVENHDLKVLIKKLVTKIK
jgi:glycosyltransferase involved in cell wall biosynthesis